MLGIVKRTGHMNIEAFTGDDILSGICFIVQHLQGGGRRGGLGAGGTWMHSSYSDVYSLYSVYIFRVHFMR